MGQPPPNVLSRDPIVTRIGSSIGIDAPPTVVLAGAGATLATLAAVVLARALRCRRRLPALSIPNTEAHPPPRGRASSRPQLEMGVAEEDESVSDRTRLVRRLADRIVTASLLS